MLTRTTDADLLTETPLARRSRLTISAARSFVGATAWLSPAFADRTYGYGLVDRQAGSFLVGRLFGARDLALGLAVQHPDPAVRRAALQTGIVVDAADAVSSAIALRRGASRVGTASVGVGALSLVALGIIALSRDAVESEAGQDSV
jgi:hypothetical protein